MPRMVNCIKLGREAEGMKWRPFRDELGQQLFDNVSQEAWLEWLEYSKRLINEFRLDLMAPSTQKIMREECRRYFFGEQAPQEPPDFVPPK